MLVVVSPAKNLDYGTPLPDYIDENANLAITQPELLKETKHLLKNCKTLSPADLSSLMKISDKLAILNAERFSSFSFPFTPDNARPALFAFNGDVYTGLSAQTLTSAETEYAQSHLRILSGLYGVLKPLDLMQPYRLEMGTKLKVDKHNNLYQFWGNTITNNLNQSLNRAGTQLLVNLASNEYFSSVKKRELDAKIITPHFKDEKNGKFKVISFYAKKARGLMARYIIQNKIQTVEDLTTFDIDGYYYSESESSATDLVFKRTESI